MFDFVSVDFETATRYKDSACAIGIAGVKDLKIVEKYYSLIRPPQNIYEDRNISVHGITSDQTENAPTFSELWPFIQSFFDTHTPVVAHNAGFDMSVLRASTDIEIPDFVYVDTMNIALLLFERRWSLVDCALLMGISLDSFEHHNALDDACLCAQIMSCGIKRFECNTLWELLVKNTQLSRRFFSDLGAESSIWRRTKWPNERIRTKDIQCTREINLNNPLCGKNIVFTGTLSIPREEAMQIAVNCGAQLRTSVSSKTDFLVVGHQDLDIVGDDGMSTKEEKACALNEAGKAKIQIIKEDQFMDLVGMEVHT